MDDNDRAALLLGRSKVRQRILALLVESPELRLHLRALARAAETSAGTAARELGRLEAAGLVRRTREGNQVYFQARPEQPLFAPIREIVRQTIGAPMTISRSLAGLAGVERAVIFGSYAHGPLKPDGSMIYLADGTQHIDHQTLIDHVKPNCPSRELYKGVLDARSHGVFNGKVYVHPEAQKTDGKQSNNNLLLSANARVDTKPQLEIFADDVKCTHGATVGRLDEMAMFYLNSRGIGPDAARTLLTYAFAADVLETIELEPLRNALEAMVLARFTEPLPD